MFGTEDNHDMHLHEAIESHIKLDFEKFVIKSKSYTFFGNVYTPQGVKPHPKKVEAIKKMESPKTKQELQSFLGMMNYLGQYVKYMAELTANLMVLLLVDREPWSQIPKVEDSISSDACLMYFNSSKPVILQVDASTLGLVDVYYRKTTMESWDQ